jgi:hypothetical protein
MDGQAMNPQVNGSPEPIIVPDWSEATTEQKLDLLIWLHAEQAQQVQRLAIALSGLLMQSAQPQIQQTILSQLLGQG